MGQRGNGRPGGAGRRGALALAAAAALVLGAGTHADEPAIRENPLLLSSTFLGGTGAEYTAAAEIGPDGALWVLAESASFDLPGAERTSGDAQGTDLVVLRIDLETRAVLSSAWLGGTVSVSGTTNDTPVALAF